MLVNIINFNVQATYAPIHLSIQQPLKETKAKRHVNSTPLRENALLIY